MIRLPPVGTAVLSALLMTGCASVINGHTQSVSVTTQDKGSDVAGARCSLTNDKGVWYLTSPGSAAVHRSYGELTVKCAAAGLADGSAAVKSSTTGAVFGNILVGGVIGAGVDVATGAAYNYPNLIAVQMGQSTRIEMPMPAKPAAVAAANVAAARSAETTAAERVPYLNDAQQAQYLAYLKRPLPRAFAIAASGHFASTWSLTPLDKSLPADPSARALLLCARSAGTGCELYSVDEQIVFQALPLHEPPPEARSRPGRDAADPALAAAKVPFLNDAQQVEYRTFLTHPVPRAFVISDNGHYAMAWSNTPLDKTQSADPLARALAGCKRQSGRDCSPYLVDNQIVYAPH